MVRNQLPAQVVNLLRWNDGATHVENFFVHKNCNVSSVLSISKRNSGITSNKFIITLQ